MSNSVFLKPDENGNWGSVNIASGGGVASTYATLQNAATVIGNGTILDVSQYSTLVLNLVFSGTATVTTEGSVDGTNWDAVSGYGLVSGFINIQNSAFSSNNRVRYHVAGLRYFRARISAYTSGTVDVQAECTSATMPFSQPTISTNADNTATGYHPINAGYLYGYNGSTWDRIKTNANDTFAGTGLLSSGSYVYDNSSTLWSKARSILGLADGGTGLGIPAQGMVAYNGSTYDRVRTGGTGALRINVFDTSGFAAQTSAYTSDGLGGGYQGLCTVSFNMGWNGANIERVRVGKTFKYIEYLNLPTATATTIWTPSAGKKFRLMGVQFGASAAAQCALRDGTAGSGTAFHMFKVGGADTKDFSLGNGYLSSAANNVLEIYNATGSTVSVWVTAWGTEE